MKNFWRKLTVLLLVFLLVISFHFFTARGASAEEMNESEHQWQISFSPYYTTLDPDEINDMIDEAREWSEYMEQALLEDFVAFIEEETDDVYISSSREREPARDDQIEDTVGLEMGLGYDVSGLMGRVFVAGSRMSPASDMSGKISGDVLVESREEDDEMIYIDVEGEMSHEADLNINKVSAGIQPELTDNLGLTISVGTYWGDGEVNHESTGELAYEPEDVDEYEDEELRNVIEDMEDINDAHLKYSSELEITPSLGARIGLSYDYQVSDSFNLRAEGIIREVSADIETDRDVVEVAADDTLLEDYYEDEFDFELPSEFSEDLGGLEFRLGGSYSF